MTTTAISANLIIETINNHYEIDTTGMRFRRIDTESTLDTIGGWVAYHRMSPVTLGEPVTFYWMIETSGRSARIGVESTSPVVQVFQSKGVSAAA